MDDLLSLTLHHLAHLVAFDTQNPPRNISTDGIFKYLREQLHGCTCTLIDHGAGAVSLHAVRGKPRYLWNVHLDTVPATPHWTSNPLQMHRADDKVVGLGVCDIKSAAAALVAATQSTTADIALLFTSDEEANDPRGVHAFLQLGIPYDAVIVAEPTQTKVRLAHRGIHSVCAHFSGYAGHASNPLKSQQNAIHQAMLWGARALQHVQTYDSKEFLGLHGLRFNIGHIVGGIKANVIAPSAVVRFGFRPLPSMDGDALLRAFAECSDSEPERFEETFRGPCLPAGIGEAAKEKQRAAQVIAESLELPIGSAVDFWTEASLFSAAGYVSFVYGPGDILQAHTADEFVLLSQLECYVHSLAKILRSGPLSVQ